MVSSFKNRTSLTSPLGSLVLRLPIQWTESFILFQKPVHEIGRLEHFNIVFAFAGCDKRHREL